MTNLDKSPSSSTTSPSPATLDDDEQYQWMMSITTNIADASKVRDVKVSPDGKWGLYQVQTFYQASVGGAATIADGATATTPPPSAKSELWVASLDNGIPRNSRRLFEEGPYNDRSGVWSGSNRIIFVSDRFSGPGGPGQLCISDVGEGTEVPVVLTSVKTGVSNFVVQPGKGLFVAFTTWDQLGVDDNMNKLERVSTISDAKVYGNTASSVPRLGVVDWQTRNCIVALPGALGPNAKECIESICWSPDGREILYRTRQNAKWEYTEREGEVKRVVVLEEEEDGRLRKDFGFGTLVATLSRSPLGRHLWLPSGHVASIENFVPSNILDAQTLFLASVNDLDDTARKDPIRLYGEKEDAIRMVDASYVDAHGQERSFLAVEVANGVNGRIDIVEVSDSPRVVGTLYETHDDQAIWSGAWDVRAVNNGSTVSFVLAAVLTSGPHHEPPDVWTFRASLEDLLEGKRRPLRGEPVSVSHLPWLEKLPAIRTEVVEWEAKDGTVLNGLIRYPPGYRKEDGPRPTVLHIHGGPYSRDIPDYTVYFCNWRELLAWAGYVVITPNFRGSQGRGHEFASAANKGIGVYDWPDCESMVDHFVSEGISDPARLGIAGWSHGGSLTAWGIAATKNKFKAGVVGAGATNWEGMVAESVSPELEAAVGQRNPWDHASDTGSFKSSPIHHVADIETAVLILHGEEDSGVPLGQAVGFYRGLKRKAAQRGRDTACLITYPREPHGFEERGHVQDVLMRVFDYFRRHL